MEDKNFKINCKKKRQGTTSRLIGSMHKIPTETESTTPFLSKFSDMCNRKNIRLSILINKLFGKTLKKNIRKLMIEDISNMPLYLNSNSSVLNTFARWRLNLYK